VTSVLKLPHVWRTLKETDLAAIRRDSERRFEVLVVAENGDEAARLAELLTGAGRGHPWLVLSTPDEARDRTAAAGLDAAILLSGSEDLAPPLAAAREALRKAGVPLVTVVRGAATATSAVVRPGETGRAVVPALEAEGLPAVALALVSAFDPALRLALARQLPPLRPAILDALIDETAKANATYALTTGMAEWVPVLDVPLNLADMVVLTKNQLVMSYKIALACGKKGQPRELIGEVMGVIGGGFLFRQAARQLVGLVPVAGIVPKVAMAYAGTWAVGRAVAAWASEGRKVTPAAVRRFYREAWGRGKTVARAMAAQARKARPKRSWFRRNRKPPVG
jgi:uncharacterized protein (DUF697 family)